MPMVSYDEIRKQFVEQVNSMSIEELRQKYLELAEEITLTKQHLNEALDLNKYFVNLRDETLKDLTLVCKHLVNQRE